VANKKKPRCLHCGKILKNASLASKGKPIIKQFCGVKCVAADNSLNSGCIGSARVHLTERKRREKLHKDALKGDEEAQRILREEYGLKFIFDRKNQKEISIL
jgi:hypothetical protein